MKIASAVVRRLRTARGWSQEQLAAASGLSLRTIQRVESDGAASMGTKVCLAATFGIALAELAEPPVDDAAVARPKAPYIAALVLGMAVLACVLIAESARLPDGPISTALACIYALLAVLGALLVVPAAIRLLVQRQVAGVALAVLGTPLVVLMIGGALVAAVQGHGPSWSLWAFGLGGAALLAMAHRQFFAGGTRPQA